MQPKRNPELCINSLLKYYLASSGGVKFGEKILIYLSEIRGCALNLKTAVELYYGCLMLESARFFIKI